MFMLDFVFLLDVKYSDLIMYIFYKTFRLIKTKVYNYHVMRCEWFQLRTEWVEFNGAPLDS